MILKILTRHSPNSYKSLISYILQEGKNKEGEKPEPITHNLRGNTVDEWVKEYQQHEALRNHPRSDQIYLYHEILSLNSADHQNITNEKLTDIAQEYIRQRGIQGIYVGAIHSNKSHYHIHFATSGVQLYGKANRLSRTDLKELKQNLQRYHLQRFPEIKHSNPKHGRGKEYVTDKEYQARQRNERALHKDFVKETVAECFANAKSQQEFLTRIQDAGLHAYERNNKPQGVMYDDMKFRFSRLEIDIYQLPQFALDMKKEQQTLNELHALRQSPEEKAQEKSAQLKSLTAMQLNDIRNELDKLYADKNGLFIQMTHAGFSNPKLSKDLDEIIRREAYLLSKEEELSKTVDSEKYPPKEEQKQEPIPEQPVNPPMEVEPIEHTMEYPEGNSPDIDANPELFDFETEEDIDMPDEEQQELLDELDDLREEADKDEYDMDYDDDVER